MRQVLPRGDARGHFSLTRLDRRLTRTRPAAELRAATMSRASALVYCSLTMAFNFSIDAFRDTVRLSSATFFMGVLQCLQQLGSKFVASVSTRHRLGEAEIGNPGVGGALAIIDNHNRHLRVVFKRG